MIERKDFADALFMSNIKELQYVRAKRMINKSGVYEANRIGNFINECFMQKEQICRNIKNVNTNKKFLIREKNKMKNICKLIHQSDSKVPLRSISMIQKCYSQSIVLFYSLYNDILCPFLPLPSTCKEEKKM